MCCSPAPDRPRTPRDLLKTEREPAPPNEWTPDNCQRGWAGKFARRARSELDAPTNDWRRSSKPRIRPRPVWRPHGREAFLRRDSRPQDRPACQFLRTPVRTTSLYGLVEEENPAGVAVAIYSMQVSVKAASVRNSWMQAFILNQAPHRCWRKQSP
jgi:hypothetical protein